MRWNKALIILFLCSPMRLATKLWRWAVAGINDRVRTLLLRQPLSSGNSFLAAVVSEKHPTGHGKKGHAVVGCFIPSCGR